MFMKGQENNNEQHEKECWGKWLAIGVCMSGAAGIMMDNFALGMLWGLGLGVVLAVLKKKEDSDSNQEK